MTPTPYAQLSAQSVWRTGGSQRNVSEYQGFWSSKWDLPETTRFSTYGSCFAHHVSRALKEHKLAWVNTEPAPLRTPEALAKAYSYGVYSSRTGQIHSARQLLMWLVLAADPSQCDIIETWEQGGRFYDSLRPTIEPDGFDSKAEVIASRAGTAAAFGQSIRGSDVFILTLGQTEGWENSATGQAYPSCPGTHVGAFDPQAHVFKNYTYPEVKSDLEAALQIMRQMNPRIKLILTVSPVPLIATMSGAHVLAATTYSKSVLRCVAGDLAQGYENVDYFPSYELIASAPSRGLYYEEDMRTVAREGVDLVMTAFFDGLALGAAVDPKTDAIHAQIDELVARDSANTEMGLEVPHGR